MTNNFEPNAEGAPSLFIQAFASLARSLLNAGAGVMATAGIITQEQEGQVVMIGLAVLTWGVNYTWSVIQKRNAHKALQAAIAAPAGQAS